MNSEKSKKIVYIFVLCLWLLFQYFLGNKFYAIFIFVFFLIGLRQPYFMLVITATLIIVLFNTPILPTWMQLRQSNIIAISYIKEPLYKVLTPNSGQEVLPLEVQQMLDLLMARQLIDYQLSEELYSDPLIRQRIVEAAWPIKLTKTSPYVFRRVGTEFTCKKIDIREDIELVYCR
jgi:hypothetical protein